MNIAVDPTSLAKTVSIRRPQEQTWYDVVPNERHTLVVDSRHVAGAFTIIEAVALPGAATPLHSHRECERFRILEGVTTFVVAGEVFEAAAGSTVVVPAGVAHAWKNRSAAPLRMLVIFVPGGIEEMFAQFAGADPDKVADLVAAYGSELLGPPPLD